MYRFVKFQQFSFSGDYDALSQDPSLRCSSAIGARTIFRMGKQNWWKNNKTIKFKVYLHAICIFQKRYTPGVWGKAPESWRIFVLKITLQSVSYRKKIGATGCTSCSPIILLEEQSPATPVPMLCTSVPCLGPFPLHPLPQEINLDCRHWL